MSDNLVVKFTPATFGTNFDPEHNNYLSEPEPSVRFLPDWYRKLARFQKSNNISKLHPMNDRGTDGSAAGTKLCMPFFDTLTAGYMYKLDYDVHVDLDESGFPTLTWDGEAMIIDKRNMIDVAVPTGHHPLHFGWKVNWYCETPPGYSMLITHPMNRHDLPFTTLSGIIDTDKWHTPVFTAFFLKRNLMQIFCKEKIIQPPLRKIHFTRDCLILHLAFFIAKTETYIPVFKLKCFHSKFLPK